MLGPPKHRDKIVEFPFSNSPNAFAPSFPMELFPNK